MNRSRINACFYRTNGGWKMHSLQGKLRPHSQTGRRPGGVRCVDSDERSVERLTPHDGLRFLAEHGSVSLASNTDEHNKAPEMPTRAGSYWLLGALTE